MAKSDTNQHSSGNQTNRAHQQGGTTAAERDRKRDRVVSTVKERPYTAAALATVAAGAAAFFLTRGKGDKPLMNWGQESEGDRVKGAGAFKHEGSATKNRALETASASPSSSAGTGAATGGTSPSAIQAATLSTTGTSTNAAATGSSGSAPKASSSTTAGTAAKTGDSAGGTGIDATTKDETKAGAISYGA